MAENFEATVGSLFKGMENFITSKTVVGEAMQVGDTTIIPLMDVSFGMAATNHKEPQLHGGGGGMGGKMSPNAVLVIKDGNTRIINIKNADGITKLMDAVPEVVARLKKKGPEDKAVKEAVDEMKGEEETF